MRIRLCIAWQYVSTIMSLVGGGLGGQSTHPTAIAYNFEPRGPDIMLIGESPILHFSNGQLLMTMRPGPGTALTTNASMHVMILS